MNQQKGRMNPKLSAIEIYGIAIKSEIEAARAYQQMADITNREDVRKKLKFLRDEERRHRQLLTHQYRREFPDVKLALPSEGLAPALSLAIERNTPLAKLFELAMEAERKSERFYAQAAETAESLSGRRLLNYLAGMERGHYFLLQSEYELLQQFESFASYKKFSAEHLGP